MLRNCKVKTNIDAYEEAYFHKWCDRASVEDALFVTETGGQVWDTYGLVEFMDGRVRFVMPFNIVFTDKPIKENDALEQSKIIHCRECKYFNSYSVECDHENGLMHIFKDDHNYCSYAERREE